MTDNQIRVMILRLPEKDRLQLVEDFYRVQRTKEARLRSVYPFQFRTHYRNVISVYHNRKSISDQFFCLLMDSRPIEPITLLGV